LEVLDILPYLCTTTTRNIFVLRYKSR